MLFLLIALRHLWNDCNIEHRFATPLRSPHFGASNDIKGLSFLTLSPPLHLQSVQPSLSLTLSLSTLVPPTLFLPQPHYFSPVSQFCPIVP